MNILDDLKKLACVRNDGLQRLLYLYIDITSSDRSMDVYCIINTMGQDETDNNKNNPNH